MAKSAMRLLYVVTKDMKEAQIIAKNLVDHQLIACANIVDGMHSIYRWKGKVVEDQETILILKTKMERLEEVIKKVKSLHSYECPAILTLPVEGGFEPYLQWLNEQC